MKENTRPRCCCSWQSLLLVVVIWADGLFENDLHAQEGFRGAPATPFSHIKNKTPLHLEAEERFSPRMETLLKQNNQDVNARDEEGNTPLHYAAVHSRSFMKNAAKGMTGTAVLLLEHGAEVNATNRFGNTPLHLLASRGDDRDPLVENAVGFLVEHGALVNARNQAGQTPLHSAAGTNHVALIQALLKQGADSNARDHGGRTPLHYACKEPDFGPFGNRATEHAITILLENGADADARDEEGRTPLHVLVEKAAPNPNLPRGMQFGGPRQNREARLLALLRAKPNVNAKDNHGRTPLHDAAEEVLPFGRGPHAVSILLQHGADPNARDERNQTLLHHLAKQQERRPTPRMGAGNLPFITEMDLNAQDDAGDSALHVAARSGNAPLSRMLIENGADVFLRNKADETPIWLAFAPSDPERPFFPSPPPFMGTRFDIFNAVARGDLDGVKWMIENEPRLVQAQLGAGGPGGQTLLMGATAGQQWELSEFLLESGAALDPYSAASLGRVEPVLTALKERPDLVNQPLGGRTLLFRAAEANRSEMVRVLLDNKADPLFMDHAGQTALLLALSRNHQEIADLLQGQGDDIFAWAHLGRLEEVRRLLDENPQWAQARSQIGWTPLHSAANGGRIAVLKLLLDRGADVNAKNQEGETPLHAASLEGRLEVAALLLERGAGVNLEDRVGYTPLHGAAMASDIAMAKLLLEHKADVNAAGRMGDTPLSVAGTPRKRTARPMRGILEGRQAMIVFLTQQGGRDGQFPPPPGQGPGLLAPRGGQPPGVPGPRVRVRPDEQFQLRQIEAPIR